MNKKILFVLHRIGIGGSMTSMLNLLELMKEQGLEIDLFLMEHEGIFLERAKKAANLLKEDPILSAVFYSKKKLINSKNILKISIRLIYVILHKLFGSKKVTSLIYRWRALRDISNYDNVVAFQENITTDFVQHIKAPNKIAWVHTDFERFVGTSTTDEMQKIYDCFDKIVCVSEAAKLSLIKNLNNSSEKLHVIYNTLNSNYIVEKSIDYFFETNKEYFNFISIGRFAEAKRFDRVVEVSKKLHGDGYKFKWYIVGEGILFEKIKHEIKENALEEYIILLGAQSNPYPIIKAADYVVITSLYEAHPMVANEGLILHKPVISTAFSSVYEVIKDKKNGLICENSTEGIYKCIKELLDNRELSETVKAGADDFSYSNEKILKQISDLMIWQRNGEYNEQYHFSL